MSKRHRKSKNFLSSQSDMDDMGPNHAQYDLSMFQAPKGKKPKGRQKRDSHKRAYYDD